MCIRDRWGSYISETFGVVRGGLRKGTAYTQQVNVGLDLDMERIAGWQGAKFHFILNDRAGDNTSAKYIGNFFNVQEIYGFQWAKISEISYEQDLAGKKVNLQIGYLPIGTESVSYTHLDVYKRHLVQCTPRPLAG